MRRFAVLCLVASSSFATDFLTGQAARAVMGQPSFTAQTMPTTPSASILGAASGVAYANGMLFLADDNRLGALPSDNRVLIYRNLHQQLAGPLDPARQGQRCPLCVGVSDLVLGQADFTQIGSSLSQSGLSQPTAVASDGQRLVVSDTNNNRVLIWNSIPAASNAPADLVLGQPDFTTATPNSGTAGPTFANASSLRGPGGVWIQDGKLFVADDQNHRVLIWNTFPTKNFQPADLVLGQPDLNSAIQPDLTKANPVTSATTLLNPVAVSSDGVHLFVSDLGNNRVLIWNTIPSHNQAPADVVIGQPDMISAVPNYSYKILSQNTTTNVTVLEGVLCAANGKDTNNNDTFPALCGSTLSFPRFALSDGARLFVADGGNDRVIVFNHIPSTNGAKADAVLGQPDEFTVATSDDTTSVPANPNVARRAAADAVRTPTSLAWDGDSLYVTEPFSRRIMVFSPATGSMLTPIRNAASLVVYAHATITLSGTAKEGDQVHISLAGTDYVYQLKKIDTLGTAAQGLADIINNSNNGAGDPNMLASAIPVLFQVQLTARVGGTAGNNIAVATSTSTGATTVSSASSVTGGNEAATLGPGTLISIFGPSLADSEASAPFDGQRFPNELGGVELFVDGIRSPLLYAGPTQVNAQLPWPVGDGASSSAYLRITHRDGSVTTTHPVAIPLVPANPGVFSSGGPDPRPAMAYHFTNYALGTVSVDGTPKTGAVVTVTIADTRKYTYTVKDGDTLRTIRDALISQVNASDPDVQALVGAQWVRMRLQAKQPGAAGNGIKYAAASTDSSVVLSPSNTALCCASVAGQPIDNSHPAMPGELIVVYATGLGTVHDDAGNPILVNAGVPYAGPAINVPDVFVSSLAAGKTASVLAAALVPGSIGLYQVQLELNSDLPTNPTTQVYIAQDVYISNLVTFSLVKP
jgi:uncharacterized protein (TIGR03437 family)